MANATTTKGGKKETTVSKPTATTAEKPVQTPITTGMEVTKPIIPTTPKIEEPKMSLNSLGLNIVPEKPVGGRGRSANGNSKSGEVVTKLKQIQGIPSYHSRDNDAEGWYKVMDFATKMGATSCVQNLKKSHTALYSEFEMITRVIKETGGSKLIVRYKQSA